MLIKWHRGIRLSVPVGLSHRPPHRRRKAVWEDPGATPPSQTTQRVPTTLKTEELISVYLGPLCE